MRCDEARRRLIDGRAAEAALHEHVAECSACHDFAARFAAIEELMCEPRTALTPDAGFSRRVIAHLPSDAELLGWVSWRFLPATLAVAILLVGWALTTTATPAQLVDESPTDDVLVWALESSEDVP